MGKAILYRIIGNDLPPRHEEKQALSDLRFILKYEAHFPGLEKRWLLNRIVDSSLADLCAREIEESGYRVDRIPFVADEYASIWTDLGATPDDHHPWTDEFQGMSEVLKARIADYIARRKNRYLMNNNGARNRAIELALQDAEWAFPWDGGCFLTPRAWQVIRWAMKSSELPCISVPMSRLENNALIIADPDHVPVASYEPQLGFSRQARQHFDSHLRYGSMPKAALLRQLAIPGIWHEWNKGVLPWENVDYSPTAQAGMVLQAGWVFRLNQPAADLAHTNETYLHKLRFDGINNFVRETDKQLILQVLRNRRFYCWTALEDSSFPQADPSISKLLKDRAHQVRCTAYPPLIPKLHAEGESPRGCYYVNLPSELSCEDGRSKDFLDGWNPLDWLQPGGGKEPQSDSERWSSFCDACCTLVLDYHFNGATESLEKAAELIRCWFIDPSTCMVPAVAWGQIPGEHGEPVAIGLAGILGLRQLPALLDALHIVRETDALLEQEQQTLNQWLSRLLGWLCSESTALLVRRDCSVLQAWYHLFVGVTASYLGRASLVAQVLDNLPGMLTLHFSPEGAFLGDEAHSSYVHSWLLTLEGWAGLAVLSSALGRDFLGYHDRRGLSLVKAYERFKACSHDGCPTSGLAYECSFNWLPSVFDGLFASNQGATISRPSSRQIVLDHRYGLG